MTSMFTGVSVASSFSTAQAASGSMVPPLPPFAALPSKLMEPPFPPVPPLPFPPVPSTVLPESLPPQLTAASSDTEKATPTPTNRLLMAHLGS